MSACRLILPVLLAASCLGHAAETAPAPAPWSDTFTMPLRDQERTFVTWENATWLVIEKPELKDPAFLDGKEATLIAKLMRTEGGRAWFYDMAGIEVTAHPELWRARIDGDNLYLFGRFLRDGDNLRLIVAGVANAPSDQQVIAARLDTVKAEDWDGRLAVGTWVRDQANQHGNREFWLASADAIASRVVDDILVAAEAKKDVALLLRAMTLCMESLNDPGRAARVGSTDWARKSQGAEEIALRMRKLNYEFIAGRWLPRAEAAAAEFEARFNALSWSDADGFYKLGLWCDANADLLPRAREMSFRCFQAGFRGDPNHNAIRRELGLEAVSDKTGVGIPQGDHRDPLSGVAVKGPEGWKRAAPIDGDATWIDPASETAYITAKLIRGEQVAGDFTALWNAQLATVQARTGFSDMAQAELTVTGGKARHLRYAYQEGRFTRLGDLILIQNPAGKAAVRLNASYAETEQEAVRKLALGMVPLVVIPAGDRVPGAAPAPAAPGTPDSPVPAGMPNPAGTPTPPAPVEAPVVIDPNNPS